MRFAENKHPALAIFGLLFGAVAWGVVWYPYRLLEQAGIFGLASSLYSFTVSLVLGLFLFAALRAFQRPSWTMLWLALVAGWTNLAYVMAVIDGEVMRIMLLFYLSPFWTLLLAKLLVNERVGATGLMIVALSLSGAMVMLWQPDSGLPLPQNRAEWLGLSAGIGFALTNVLTRRSQHLSLSSKSLAVWSGVVVMALLLLPFQPQALPAPTLAGATGLLWLLGIGLLLLVTTLVVQYGVTHTPVTRASVIFLFELVVAALSSWWLAGEAMSLREWVGGAMIVASSLFAARAKG